MNSKILNWKMPILAALAVHVIIFGVPFVPEESEKWDILASSMGSTNVTEMAPQDYSKMTSGQQFTWLIEIYAPWCLQSQAFIPTFEKVASTAKGIVKFARIDYTLPGAQDLIKTFNVPVTVLPTVLLLFPDGVMIKYEGTLKYADLLLFIESTVRGGKTSMTLSMFSRISNGPIRWFYDSLIFCQFILGARSAFSPLVLGTLILVLAGFLTLTYYTYQEFASLLAANQKIGQARNVEKSN